MKDPKLSTTTPSASLPGGAPASYWLSLRECDPVGVSKSLKLAMLIFQAKRNYQVTMDDYWGWNKGPLESQRTCSSSSIRSAITSSSRERNKSTPAEYQKPGNVAEAVDSPRSENRSPPHSSATSFFK